MKDIHIYELSLFAHEKKIIYTQLPYNKEKYNIVFDPINPQYVLVPISHLISSQEIYSEFKKIYNSNCIYIFFGDECISPDLNLFDYAITYDDDFVCCDRVFRHPITWIIREFIEGYVHHDVCLPEEYDRRGFCNFIYYNGMAHPKRDELFYAINQYKRVDSLGKHLNNCEIPITRFESNYFGVSVDMKSNYRFSIAAENDNFRGNTTEKIISSFFAHTIPIYWGNPNIESEFNPKSFINCHKYHNFNEVVEAIREINEDKDKWVAMAMEPMKTKEQERRDKERIVEYEQFIDNIFSQTIEEAKRVTIGTAEKSYLDFWINTLQWEKKKKKRDNFNLIKQVLSPIIHHE